MKSNSKKKRGQITAFIIAGLVLLFIIGATWISMTIISKGKIKPAIEEVQKIPLEEATLKNYVENCITIVSVGPIKTIALQGGTLNLTDYIWYDESKFNVLCYNLEGYKGCVNSLLLRQQMEEELSREIKLLLKTCINLKPFEEKGYNVTTGLMDVKTEIGLYDITFKLTYPIKLQKQDHIFEISEFSSTLDYPLGELYELTADIVNSEITNSNFNKDEFMVESNPSIKIQKHRPYPNIVYSLTKHLEEINEDFTFRFAVQGKDTVSMIGSKMPDEFAYGCCYNAYDNVCFKNTDNKKCATYGLGYDSDKTCSCDTLYKLKDNLCNGRQCRDCNSTYEYETEKFTGPSRKHGESWCSYDSPVLSKEGTGGMSYVGSRHYLHSCIDGVEYVEECRDYREELCTQQTTNDFTKAACRPNRWQDCFAQKNKQDCENSELRDCQWTDWLPTQNKCHPIIPPGFKFWQGNGFDVCAAATTYQRCDGFSCGNTWVDDTAIYCYFQGDCGNYRNIADKQTRGGFFNSDPLWFPRSYVYQQSGLNKNPAEIGKRTLNIDLNKREQEEITWEFPEPMQTLPVLVSAALNYLDYLSHLDISTFLNPFEKPEIEVLDYAFCGLWLPPTGGDDCNLCKEPFKPCTEYRCKSLGQLCEYEEKEGVGYCYAKVKNDTVPPEIDFDPSLLKQGFSAEPAQLNIIDTTIYGVEIDPAIVPLTLFTFGINTTEPARCKLGYLPNISYAYLPSIWFGDATFNTQHNLSLRIPPALVIPSKIYQVLNVSDLTQVINLLDDLEGTYERYKQRYSTQLSLYKMFTGFDVINAIDPFVKIALRLIQQYSPLYAKIKVLSEIMLKDFDENKYYIFVKCIDQAGNENQKDFFIKFRINTTINDTEAPVILKTIPENNENISKDLTSIDFKLYTNEVAECRYSLADQSYQLMPNKLTCPNSIYELSPVLGGSYECSAVLPLTENKTTYYFRCQDNPPKLDRYKLNLANSTNLTANINTSRYFNLTEPNIVSISSSLLKKEPTVNITTPDINFEVYINEPRYCRYSAADVEFDDMQNTFNCLPANPEYVDMGIYKCSSTISLNKSIFIRCRDVNITKRNTNTESYIVVLFKS